MKSALILLFFSPNIISGQNILQFERTIRTDLPSFNYGLHFFALQKIYDNKSVYIAENYNFKDAPNVFFALININNGKLVKIIDYHLKNMQLAPYNNGRWWDVSANDIILTGNTSYSVHIFNRKNFKLYDSIIYKSPQFMSSKHKIVSLSPPSNKKCSSNIKCSYVDIDTMSRIVNTNFINDSTFFVCFKTTEPNKYFIDYWQKKGNKWEILKDNILIPFTTYLSDSDIIKDYNFRNLDFNHPVISIWDNYYINVNERGCFNYEYFIGKSNSIYLDYQKGNLKNSDYFDPEKVSLEYYKLLK